MFGSCLLSCCFNILLRLDTLTRNVNARARPPSTPPASNCPENPKAGPDAESEAGESSEGSDESYTSRLERGSEAAAAPGSVF